MAKFLKCPEEFWYEFLAKSSKKPEEIFEWNSLKNPVRNNVGKSVHPWKNYRKYPLLKYLLKKNNLGEVLEVFPGKIIKGVSSVVSRGAQGRIFWRGLGIIPEGIHPRAYKNISWRPWKILGKIIQKLLVFHREFLQRFKKKIHVFPNGFFHELQKILFLKNAVRGKSSRNFLNDVSRNFSILQNIYLRIPKKKSFSDHFITSYMNSLIFSGISPWGSSLESSWSFPEDSYGIFFSRILSGFFFQKHL